MDNYLSQLWVMITLSKQLLFQMYNVDLGKKQNKKRNKI